MKTISYFFNKILYPACLFFTVLIFALGAVTMSLTEVYNVPILNMTGISLTMLFCFGFACVNRILFIGSFKVATRILLHFVGFIAIFALVFIVIGGFSPSVAASFTVLAAVACVYVLIAAVVLAVRAVAKKKKTEKSDYKRQFSK